MSDRRADGHFMLSEFYVDTNSMKALTLSIVIGVFLADCSHANPITVSQQAMNADMLERVKAEGTKACKSDGGLKGITWAYNSMPGGNHLVPPLPPEAVPLPHGASVKYGDLPNPIQSEIRKQEKPEEYDVGVDMANLAAAAPKTYVFTADAGATSATYICTDGAENSSAAFVFVP
jgi:hypothetical protein